MYDFFSGLKISFDLVIVILCMRICSSRELIDVFHKSVQTFSQHEDYFYDGMIIFLVHVRFLQLAVANFH